MSGSGPSARGPGRPIPPRSGCSGGGSGEEVDLIRCGVEYTVGAVAEVTPDLLHLATPCRQWDLRALLNHLNDSMDLLYEVMDRGYVGPGSSRPPLPADGDPTTGFLIRAARLLRAWRGLGAADRPVAVVDRVLVAGLVASTGATEIAVHGWDVYRACGHDRPIPFDLALELLERCVVPQESFGREPLFGRAVPVVATAGPSDRLLARLGRDPTAAPS
jgi:uncharacterized protein (TIGR03086 family)